MILELARLIGVALRFSFCTWSRASPSPCLIWYGAPYVKTGTLPVAGLKAVSNFHGVLLPAFSSLLFLPFLIHCMCKKLELLMTGVLPLPVHLKKVLVQHPVGVFLLF